MGAENLRHFIVNERRKNGTWKFYKVGYKHFKIIAAYFNGRVSTGNSSKKTKWEFKWREIYLL